MSKKPSLTFNCATSLAGVFAQNRNQLSKFVMDCQAKEFKDWFVGLKDFSINIEHLF